MTRYLFFLAPLTLFAFVTPVLAATLDSATLSRNGIASEIRFRLSGDAPRYQLSSHRNELWIDLNGTVPQMSHGPFEPVGYEPIKSVRIVTPSAMSSRIVVLVNGRCDYAIAQRRDEIVLRLAPAGAVANIARPFAAPTSRPREPDQSPTPNPPPLVARTEPPPVVSPQAPPHYSAVRPAPMAGNPLVMIDPGHGGYDPGTQSSSGVLEKDLALDISRRVQSALTAYGVRSQMTRDSDYFIPLSERTRRANVADADLFVSIHLNSSPNPETTGIEVYYLNNTTDHATIRLAEMENAGVTGTSAPSDADLNYILADLRQNFKANEAASLARMIDTQAVADLNSHLGLEVNALGAKKGPFYVLVGAHMPAVLVECGFLSNDTEASRLASPSYQDGLASGIAGAIVDYLSSSASVGNL